jgi:hypothetical protein
VGRRLAGTFPVIDPATGDTLVEIADASPEDGIRALDAAVAAQDAWAATPARTRSDILRRAFDLLTERADEFALLMTLEMGKPLAEARGEVTYGGEFLRWFSEEAVRIAGRYGSNPEGTGRMIVSQRPVGPCFFITPWNFPLAMATRKIAPRSPPAAPSSSSRRSSRRSRRSRSCCSSRRACPRCRQRRDHDALGACRRRSSPTRACASFVHGLDAGRQEAHRAGGRGRAARVDGARRQRAVRRLRRRRPRQGRRRRDGREVPQHRPGLHRRRTASSCTVVAEEFAAGSPSA